MTGAEAGELAGLCRQAAASLDWAQAAGGNASLKDATGAWLAVKASGLRLGEVTERTGWVSVGLGELKACLKDAALDALPHAAQQDAAGERLAKALAPDSPPGRPSLEAEFHALGGRACLHVHLVEASAFLCLEQGRELLADALKPLGLAWAWADYRPPGHSLAVQVARGLEASPDAQLAFLSRHGLIAWAGDGPGALALVAKVQAALAAALGPLPPPELEGKGLQPCLAALAAAFPHLPHQRRATLHWAASLALGGEGAWQPICPDDVIYCGEQVPLLAPAQAAEPEALRRLFSPQPRQAAVAVEGLGVCLAAADQRKAVFMEEMLHANARARALGRRLGKVWPLTPEQGRELLGMKGEQYRQSR